MSYKVFKNKEKTYKSTGGQSMVVNPSSEYSIYWVHDGHELHVLDIKNHFKSPEAIAKGICKLLNKGDIILPLDL